MLAANSLIAISNMSTEALIVAMRNKLLDTPLAKIEFSDHFLEPFLKATDFNPTMAVEYLRRHVTAKKQFPRLFGRFDNPIKTVFENNWINHIPSKLPTGELVIIIRLGEWDPSKGTMVDLFAAAVTLLEGLSINRDLQGSPTLFVLDMTNYGFKQSRGVKPKAMVNFFTLIDEYLPIKLIDVIIINENSAFKIIFGVVKTFLKKSMKEKIKFFGKDVNKLHERIPKEFLPTVFSGFTGPFDNRKVYTDLCLVEGQLIERWQHYQI